MLARAPVLLALAAGAGLVAAFAVAFGLPIADHLLLQNTLENHGIAGRLGLWAACLSMFSEARLLGHGAQSFGPQDGLFLTAWSPRAPERHVLSAHNLFFETLSEQGIVDEAALLFLLLHPAALWCQIGRASIDEKQRLAVVCGVAALLGFAVAAPLELSFVRRIVPLMLFASLGFAWRSLDAARQPPAGEFRC